MLGAGIVLLMFGAIGLLIGNKLSGSGGDALAFIEFPFLFGGGAMAFVGLLLVLVGVLGG